MLALLLTLAAADPPPPGWQGVWRIGTLPVRACLARLDDGETVGAYYYRSKLRPIPLTQAGTSRVWTEGNPAPNGPPPPRWTFAEIAGAVGGAVAVP